MEPPKFTVRWESAAPVRAAAEKAQSPAAKAIADWVQDYDVVTVSSSGRRGFMSRGPREGRPAGGNDERWQQMRQPAQERMKAATSLTVAGKDPIAPERVERIESKDAMITKSLFPRKDTITADDKEVTFESAMGPMEFQSKFALGEMLYKGKLEM